MRLLLFSVSAVFASRPALFCLCVMASVWKKTGGQVTTFPFEKNLNCMYSASKATV